MRGRGTKPIWLRIRKADVTFVVGLGLAVREIVFTSLERPSVLIFIAGLLGYPIWVRADEARRAANGKSTSGEDQ